MTAPCGVQIPPSREIPNCDASMTRVRNENNQALSHSYFSLLGAIPSQSQELSNQGDYLVVGHIPLLDVSAWAGLECCPQVTTE